MYGIKIDGVSYNVGYEYPITYTIDKSLDFGSINIPAISQKEPFSMYALVEITRDNDEVEYFLTSGDVIQLSSSNPPRYSHTIQLVEYTKKLENYLISSATFTQPTDGTIKYSYYDVLERLIKISVFETSSRETAVLPCVLDVSLQEKLTGLNAPEFFFYNKTLREALDEVLATLPAIARLKRVNGVDTLFADFLDITEAIINNPDQLSYNAEQNVTNYATTLVSDLSNSIRGRKGTESVTIYPNSKGWAPLTNPTYVKQIQGGEGVIDDSRSVMDVKQGIYDIVSLQVKSFVVLTGERNLETITLPVQVLEFDLSRFVVTKDQYNALKGSWDNGPIGRIDSKRFAQDLPDGITQAEMIEQGLLNQQNAIWFEPGTNFIDGLTTDWRSGFATLETQRRRSLENAMLTALNKDALASQLNADGFFRLEIGRSVNDPNISAREGWELALFRCVFIPQERNNRVEVERLDLTNFGKKASTYFKQTANLINLNAYLNKMNADLQRIGEEVFVINAIHQSFGDLLKLGDITTEGYVLFSISVVQHLDFIEVAYNFSKNYQQINELIAVDKTNDYFALVGDDKVLDRTVIYKDFVVLSDGTFNIDSDITLLTPDGIETYLSTFVENGEPLLIENMQLNGSEDVVVSVNGSGSGSNLVLTAGFNNTAIAGFEVIEDEDTGAYISSPVFYAENGELQEFDLTYHGNYLSRPFAMLYEEYSFSNNIPYLGSSYLIKDTDTGIYHIQIDSAQNTRQYTENVDFIIDLVRFNGNGNVNNIIQGMDFTYEIDDDFEIEVLNFRLLPKNKRLKYEVDEFGAIIEEPLQVPRTDFKTLITNLNKNIGSFQLYKDAGERLQVGYQIQAVVAPNNIGQIIVGNYFHNYNHLVHQPKEPLFLHFVTEEYSKGDVEKVKINAEYPFGIPLQSEIQPFNVIRINNSIPLSAKSYGVSDARGQLLFAVNRVDGVLPKSIRFVFTHTRPGLQKL